ncbi:unnamed protein product [Linum trigynum]|uniref:PRISE-like Rossmann-fold domain-containing protein n=1 Tax=Linum trigynum TaxID=586398 RepID=A0AAV2FWE4_9ROSI
MASSGRAQNQEASAAKNVAIIFGVTGLVGREIARKLISTTNPKWKVYGVAREPDRVPLQSPNYHFIPCDLLNPLEARTKLSLIPDPTHLFWVTWAAQHPLDSQQCCDQNRAMMFNALDPLLHCSAGTLKHVSLQTGLKHYVSLREIANSKRIVGQRYDEGCPRVEEGFNFYYALEDLLKERLQGGRVAWSVLRPGLVTGNSSRSMYNLIGSLCVYGTICRRLNLPFVFGGTRDCWEEEYMDGSDAGLVAEHHIWAATEERVRSTDGQALNSVNGPGFAWREIWPVIGEKMGLAVPEEALAAEGFRFAAAMEGMEEIWGGIVAEEGLVETEIGDLANWEFLDVLFRFPIKLLGSREKSDRLGFTARREMAESVSFWIDAMREDMLIPREN